MTNDEREIIIDFLAMLNFRVEDLGSDAIFDLEKVLKGAGFSRAEIDILLESGHKKYKEMARFRDLKLGIGSIIREAGVRHFDGVLEAIMDDIANFVEKE